MTAESEKSAQSGAQPELGLGLTFAALYGRAGGAERSDTSFLAFLKAVDPNLHSRLDNIYRDGTSADRKMQANLLRELVPHIKGCAGAVSGDAVRPTADNSPMQCTTKEICGQGLQRHRIPFSDEAIVVFSCACQDQPLGRIDFHNLRARPRKNSVQEKLAWRWIQFVLSRESVVENAIIEAVP
jgi:hypothetical protein